jgi:hypothetical protein
MNDLNDILVDAQRWLAAQPEPARGSATWCGFNNFRRFIASLQADSSAFGIERACHTLGWHISDQYGAYDELIAISQFNERVRQVGRAIRRRE